MKRCGVDAAARTCLGCVGVIIATVVLATVVTTRRDRDAPFPGVTRIGAPRARALWDGLPTLPGYRGVECAGERCVVRFDAALWARMPDDLRRDVVSGIGIGAAAARGARWTVFHADDTAAELARYSAADDDVRIR